MKQLDIIADLLKEGRTVKIAVRGNSMRPYLVHDRDYVLLQHADDVQVGDIVLALLSPGHYVLHRVVSVSANMLLTLQGDGNLTTEHCPASAVCGVVTAFYRNHSQKTTPVTALSYRMYKSFWMHSLPLRRVMLKLHHLMFRSCKDLKQKQNIDEKETRI